MTCIAPVTDLRFLWRESIDLGRILAATGDDDITDDLVDSIIEEAGRFADEVLAPLNAIGDRDGSRLVDGIVRTPPGFADADRGFVDGGWPAIGFDAAWGGQPVPRILAAGVEELWAAANMAFAVGPMLSDSAARFFADNFLGASPALLIQITSGGDALADLGAELDI